MKTSALLSLLFLAGCSWSVRPVVPPVAPPPNVPGEVLLLTVPDAYVEDLRSPQVEAHLASELPRLEASEPLRAEQVQRHEILTGMSSQHVVWAFRTHPTRVLDDGPPGGHTLLWGQGSPFDNGRYWVRLDEWGHVTAAGRY